MNSIKQHKVLYRRLFCKVVVLSLVLLAKSVAAQTIPVGQMDMDATLRNLQLMGKLDSDYSFTARPFYYTAFSKEQKNAWANTDPAALLKEVDSTTQLSSVKYLFQKKKISLALLPAIFTTKFNSHHPYGWNDEGMLSAKGVQTELSAGIYARVGPLSVQLQPQFVYAANPQFDTNASYGARTNGAFSKLFPGQSSVRLHVGPVSLGYSGNLYVFHPGLLVE